jgi:hypothetical protein
LRTDAHLGALAFGLWMAAAVGLSVVGLLAAVVVARWSGPPYDLSGSCDGDAAGWLCGPDCRTRDKCQTGERRPTTVADKGG